MRAAARLQIDILDAQETHAAEARRRLHAHRADELGTRGHFIIGDPFGLHAVRAADQRVELRFDGFALDRLDRREIEPRVFRRDAAAVDGIRQHRADQMARRMQPHAPVTLRPVDLRAHLVAGFQLRKRILLTGRGNVNRVIRRCAFELRLARIGDRDDRAVRERQRAGIARLAAAERIEHGLIEVDALLVDGGDGRVATRLISVLAKECACAHGRASLR